MKNSQNIDKEPLGNLYVIACGAYPATKIHEFIKLAQNDGWDVCPIASPQATQFVNIPLIEKLTGYPVRTQYKQPGSLDIFPPADAIIVIPATFNTINKWALGISDTLGIGILCEHLGRGTPIMAVPWPNKDLARHPAYPKSIEILKNNGVYVLDERAEQNFSEAISWTDILEKMNSHFLSTVGNHQNRTSILE